VGIDTAKVLGVNSQTDFLGGVVRPLFWQRKPSRMGPVDGSYALQAGRMDSRRLAGIYRACWELQPLPVRGLGGALSGAALA
jgi:hypothetical protein